MRNGADPRWAAVRGCGDGFDDRHMPRRMIAHIMNIAISLILVVVFLLMNAFFVVAEFALVRVRRSQLEMAIEEGKPGARAAKEIADNINAYLSACQLGITLASLALGFLGEPAFSALIHPLLDLLSIPDAVISAIAIAFGYIVMTVLHVVVGELIPKSFAIFSTERYALFTARPLNVFYHITYPVMWLFNEITTHVVKLFGHDPANEHEVYTGEEIKLLIDESTESGLIDEQQNEYVDNIFDLGDKDAEAIMTPRTDLVCIDLEDSLEENLRLVTQYKYTRYPVCRENKDRIVGFVHVKDLYLLPEGASIDDLPIRSIEAVPEGISLAKLIHTLQSKHTKIAVVVDEHGGTAGIVTMSDVMEQIVGRVDDEYFHGDIDEVVEKVDGSYLIEGSLPIDELEDVLGFLPDEAEEVETAGGLLLSLFDRIPDEGDTVSVESRGTKATFTVSKMDVRRIDKIDLVIEQKPDEDEAEA